MTRAAVAATCNSHTHAAQADEGERLGLREGDDDCGCTGRYALHASNNNAHKITSHTCDGNERLEHSGNEC